MHHHGGRNRTGPVSKAWPMRIDGDSERDTRAWVAERWQRQVDDNESFVEFLRGHCDEGKMDEAASS